MASLQKQCAHFSLRSIAFHLDSVTYFHHTPNKICLKLVKRDDNVQKDSVLATNGILVSSALHLLRHALELVTQQPFKTMAVLRPALVMMLAVGLSTAIFAPELLMLDPAKPNLETIKSMELTLLLLATFILSYALMAVLWHRHTLKESHNPRPISTQLVFGYLWRVLALALIQLIAGIVLVTPLITLGKTSAAGPALISMMLTTFVTQLLLMWLSLRLSLILPAAAVGRPISIMASWRATEPLSRSLWGVASALALVNAMLSTLLMSFEWAHASHALALELPIYIIEGLMIFSVLTTLYARQIQHD